MKRAKKRYFKKIPEFWTVLKTDTNSAESPREKYFRELHEFWQGCRVVKWPDNEADLISNESSEETIPQEDS